MAMANPVQSKRSSPNISSSRLTFFTSPRTAACRKTQPSTAGTMYNRAGCAALNTFMITIVEPRPRT
eukprot:1160699-Pelagomonas_calceolata.AAC.3